MSTSLTLTGVGGRVNWQYDSVLTWGNASNSAGFSNSTSFAQGTGIGACNKILILSGTIAASGTLNKDLSGALTDIYGNALIFTAVKVLYLELTTDTTSTGLVLGNHASSFGAGTPALLDAVTSTIRIANGGSILIVNPTAAGYQVVATTGDILLLTNEDSSNIATYKLLIAGIG